MYGVNELRDAIYQQVEAKANARAAGQGLWAWYVRASMFENTPTTGDEFDLRATAIKDALEAIKPMSKAERNSIASAKSIVKACVEAGVDVWKRTASGDIEKDATGQPMPRGKSDLQNDKTPMEKLLKTLSTAETMVQADDWPTLSESERLEVLAKVKSILASCGVKF